MFESLSRVTLYVEKEKRVKYDYCASDLGTRRLAETCICLSAVSKEAGMLENVA